MVQMLDIVIVLFIHSSIHSLFHSSFHPFWTGLVPSRSSFSVKHFLLLQWTTQVQRTMVTLWPKGWGQRNISYIVIKKRKEMKRSRCCCSYAGGLTWVVLLLLASTRRKDKRPATNGRKNSWNWIPLPHYSSILWEQSPSSSESPTTLL